MQYKHKQIPNKILIEEVRKALLAGKSATFRVKGFSMRLFLENERDIVKIASVPPENIRRGDVVLAEVKADLFVLHRVIRRSGDALTLMGDGNIRGTESCRVEDVVGKVTEFYRKGRTKPDSVNGWKWKVYSSIWLAATPVRRIILGICRRLPFNI